MHSKKTTGPKCHTQQLSSTQLIRPSFKFILVMPKWKLSGKSYYYLNFICSLATPGPFSNYLCYIKLQFY